MIQIDFKAESVYKLSPMRKINEPVEVDLKKIVLLDFVGLKMGFDVIHLQLPVVIMKLKKTVHHLRASQSSQLIAFNLGSLDNDPKYYVQVLREFNIVFAAAGLTFACGYNDYYEAQPEFGTFNPKYDSSAEVDSFLSFISLMTLKGFGEIFYGVVQLINQDIVDIAVPDYENYCICIFSFS
ncbi:MAG: hypothetical protein EZS28_042376 [Streblomastix strix]|uniref:Uncharacterized protein n=1 Tax=Streblomastix strix TaxID=222440 RepID=A0A5J4TUY7_9EUKA|nr:MAG: hypothetical protein EZS28_042376 [Streblomastix strix]